MFNFNALAPKQLRSEFSFQTLWVALRLTLSTTALILFAFDSKKQSTDTVRGWFAVNTLFFNANSCISKQASTRTNGAQKKNKTVNRSIDGICFVRWGFSFVFFYLCNHKSFVIACTITLLVAFSLERFLSLQFWIFARKIYSHRAFSRFIAFPMCSFARSNSFAANVSYQIDFGFEILSPFG